MTAVAAERDAVLRGLGRVTEVRLGPYALCDTGTVSVLAAGVGPAAAAAATGTVLALSRYDLVVSMGVAGGFAGRSGLGDVVVAERLVAADLGAQTAGGFRPLSALGLGVGVVVSPPALVGALADRLRAAGLPVATGPVLTVSTMTGTDTRAAELARSWAPAAEAMEGHGVATAAGAHGTAVAEVRTVSNAVGRRDSAGWDLPRALTALAGAGAALFAEEALAWPCR